MRISTGMRRRDLLAAAGSAAIARAAKKNKIRVGCQTRAYGSPLPDPAELLSVLEDLDETGYEGFETNYRSLEHAFESPWEIRREIEARGVELIGLHLGVGLYDPAKIPEERALIERVALGCRSLGGEHVIVSGRPLPLTAEGRPDPDALAGKARQLTKAGRRCADLGVRLSFHNHAHEVRNDAEEIRAVLDKTDPQAVGLLFDVGHVLHNELDVPAFVRVVRSRLTGLHVRDVKDGEEVLIGTGAVDFEGLGQALRDTEWSGWMIVEVNQRDDVGSKDLVLRARRHLRKTVGV